MLTDIEEFVYRPKVTRKHCSSRSNFNKFNKQNSLSTQKSIKSNTLTPSSSFNEGSTLRDSTEITFENFESELEQDCIYDEINAILRGDCYQSEEKKYYQFSIERPKNPFDKNFLDEEGDE